MDHYIEYFIDKSNKISDKEILTDLYSEYIDIFGYNRLVYTFITDHKVAKQKAGHGIVCQYPADWMQYYEENKYEKDDPVVIYAKRASGSFTWSQVISDPLTPKKHIKILEEAQDANLHDGVVIPLYGPRNEVAGLGLARKEQEGSPDKNTLSLLSAITEQFHFCYCDLSSSTNVIDSNKILTPRQIEILQWLAIAKSSSEISIIIGVGENTVKYHIKEIYKRLETNTRITAVVKAIRLGIITLDQIKT